MSAAREPIVRELAAALDDVLEKTTWEGKGKHIAPALLAALGSRGLVLVERVGVSSLRAPQSGPWELVESFDGAPDSWDVAMTRKNGRRTRIEFPWTRNRVEAEAVRDALNAVAGSGAETPPQPETK